MDIYDQLLPEINYGYNSKGISQFVEYLLKESAPSIYLLNSLKESSFYIPDDPIVFDRCQHIYNLVETLNGVYLAIGDNITYLSVISALISFHRKETTYIRIVDFLLSVDSVSPHISTILRFLDKSILHYPVPFLKKIDKENLEEISFTESESEIEEEFYKQRVESCESIIELAEKNGRKGLMGLYLTLEGVIPYQDFIIQVPSLSHVSLDLHRVPMVPKKKSDLGDIEMNRISASYVLPSSEQFSSSRHGISYFEDLIENTVVNCVSNYKIPGFGGEDFDRHIHTSINNACEELHDIDVKLVYYNSLLTDIRNGYIHKGFFEFLRDNYTYQWKDVFIQLVNYPSTHVVIESSLKSLIYRNTILKRRRYPVSISRLMDNVFHIFPHLDVLSKGILSLLSIMSVDDNGVISRLYSNLFHPSEHAKYRIVNKTITRSDLYLISRFCSYYHHYIMKYYPEHFYRPVPQLTHISVQWKYFFSNMLEGLKNDMVKEGIQSRMSSSFDDPDSILYRASMHVFSNISADSTSYQLVSVQFNVINGNTLVIYPHQE